MRLAVLGAGGFVGSHLVEHLIERDEHDVVGVDISAEKLEGIEGPRFVFRHGDVVASPDLLEEVVAASDLVVNLVAYANPSIYVSEPLKVFQLNFQENLKVVESCIRHRRRLIQYSSAEIYGKAHQGTTYGEYETDMVFGPVQMHRWIYASAKALLERIIYAHGEVGDLDYTVIRPFNFIGSRFDYLVPAASVGGPRVFAHFMSALLSGGPMYLVDGGHAHRAFLHIADANTAVQTILDNLESTSQGVYNVGNPNNNLTIRELAGLMQELYEELAGKPSSSRLIEMSGEEFYGVGYEDSDRLPPDISRLRALGWEPRHDLRTTFRDAMAYYLSGEGKRTELAAGTMDVTSE